MTTPTTRATDASALRRINTDVLSGATLEQLRAIRRLAAGDQDTAELLDRLDQLPAGAVLVVVGETKKGKSSVVNALVGRPKVSPVAVGVATATYLMLSHGPQDQAQVQPVRTQRRLVPLTDLPKWVTVDGLDSNPEAIGSDGDTVANPVQAFLDVPLLREVTIIDTPGVGGLVGTHAAQTVAAIRLAGAMLFITDITVPLTAPEAEFLTEVARTANLADIIIVANMADKLTPDNRLTAVRDLRLRIKEKLPQFDNVPIVAVSALQAEKAATATLPQLARELLRESSGLNELNSMIRQRVLSRGVLIRETQRLQIIHLTAARLAERADAGIRAATETDPTDGTSDLPTLLADLSHDAEVTRTQLHADLGKLQRTLSSRVDEAVRRVGATMDHAAAKGTAVAELEPQWAAETMLISDELARLTATGIGAAFRTAIDRLGTDEASMNALEIAMATATASAAADIELRTANPHLQTQMSGDTVAMAALSATGGAAFTHSVGGGALGLFGIGGVSASMVLGPVSLAMAAGVVALNVIRGRRQARAADSRGWVRDRTAMFQRDANDALASRVEDARTLFALSLRDFTRARATTLKETHVAAKGQPRTSIPALTATRAQAQAIAGATAKILAQVATISALDPGRRQLGG